MTQVVEDGIKDAAKAGMKPVSFLTPTYRYGVVLGLLMVTFLFLGISPSGRYGPLVTLTIESATLLVALSASGARRVVVIAAAVASVLAISSGVLHAINDTATDLTLTSGMSALLILVAPVAIAASVIRRRKVDVQAVLAAVCLYVMIGMFFSYVYSAVQAGNAHHVFFVQTANATPSDFLYFSFTVVTTVGFGDFTAASGFGRTLSVFEAMVGQLYLVTVVALLVSNLGPAAAARKRASESSEGKGAEGDDAPSGHDRTPGLQEPSAIQPPGGSPLVDPAGG
jgi:hypothetical protein